MKKYFLALCVSSCLTMSAFAKTEQDVEKTVLFSNWFPMDLPWASYNTRVWNSIDWNDQEVFKQIYKRAPEDHENVFALNKAGAIVNFVFGLSPAPTGLSQEEWDYLFEAGKLMSANDPSIDFAVSMTLANILEANPHLDFEFQKDAQ